MTVQIKAPTLKRTTPTAIAKAVLLLEQVARKEAVRLAAALDQKQAAAVGAQGQTQNKREQAEPYQETDDYRMRHQASYKGR
jgi:hypothetical protein